MRRPVLGGVALALLVPFLSATQSPAATPGVELPERRRAAPELNVTVVADDLDHPWDIRQVDDTRYLVTERNRRRLTMLRDGGETVGVDLKKRRRIWVSGETGLMGLAVDPRFDSNRRIYMCSGWKTDGGGHDVRVVTWRLSKRLTSARPVDTLIKGLPSTSGRHGGCRLLIADNGALLVGTGDAAVSGNPQDLGSLGGKTLRLDPRTGKPWPTNPWAKKDGPRRFVLTYGHRNVQGLAQRKDGSLWSVEHGSFRDDEINRLRPGGNYGWDPDPGYDESVPMTDHSLPGKQVNARWSSGTPTIATSGADWVAGEGWGAYRGTLAVGCLGGQRLMFVKFTAKGKLRWDRAPAALREYGRLRGVTRDTDGSLLVTTDNGSGNDRILRVRPAG